MAGVCCGAERLTVLRSLDPGSKLRERVICALASIIPHAPPSGLLARPRRPRHLACFRPDLRPPRRHRLHQPASATADPHHGSRPGRSHCCPLAARHRSRRNAHSPLHRLRRLRRLLEHPRPFHRPAVERRRASPRRRAHPRSPGHADPLRLHCCRRHRLRPPQHHCPAPPH